MKLIYKTSDRVPFGKNIAFAVQQILAILASAVAVPMILQNGINVAAGMFATGIGTLIYILCTEKKSPVIVSSSFSILGCALTAIYAAGSHELAMLGLVIGAFGVALVYLILSAAAKKTGAGWIDRLMPPVVMGPVVSLIGLTMAKDMVNGMKTGAAMNAEGVVTAAPWAILLCSFAALFVTILCSAYGKGFVKAVPFIFGVAAGYMLALAFTLTGSESLRIIDFTVFDVCRSEKGFVLLSVPNFVFADAVKGIPELSWPYVITVLTAYVPISFVCVAEHIADHKNISSIIGSELLVDPGFDKTLRGDGIASFFGALFCGTTNTTYGESIACVALTGNASVSTTVFAAFGCMILAFVNPLMAFFKSIPNCVISGICLVLFGFIAVSGFKMIQKTDLDDVRNLFTVSVVLMSGLGGLTVNIGPVTITTLASALILGVAVNKITHLGKNKE